MVRLYSKLANSLGCLRRAFLFMTPSLLGNIRALLASMPARRRMQLVWLLGLMCAGALAEVISLGAIVPFLAIMADPAQALQRPLVRIVVETLGLSSTSDIRWQVTMLFSGTVVGAGVVRFILIYVTAKVNYGIGHELGAEVYRRTLYQPYEIHVARNSSEIMGGIGKVDVVVWLIAGLLNICSAVLIAIFISATLVLINPLVASLALLGFGGIYSIISLITRKKLTDNSEAINTSLNSRVQSVQEGLGGIRDVLIDHSQSLFCNRFNQIDWRLRQAQASNNIIGPSPRFAVEALGMVLIASLVYHMTSSGGGVADALPTLGALALGAQRLMPMLQMTYQGWVLVTGNRQVLHDVVALLQQPVEKETQAQVAQLTFAREIRLQEVSFRYHPTSPLVLQHLNLSIPKGSRVGFVGTTGSGKSTVMDILMGLLQPSSGQILVDNLPLCGATRPAWQCNVAHVPQSIFLSDASFAENIAFGVSTDEIDIARVRHAAQRAQIDQFIESTSRGYETMVGERGVRLSGGQRQRIGIARALYKRATLLVFDEATSALDSVTEDAVMKAIEGLSQELTILLIAHRLSTLKNCTHIVELNAGCIKRVCTYQDLLSQGD